MSNLIFQMENEETRTLYTILLQVH